MKKFHVAKTLQFDTQDNISWAAGFGTLTLTMGVSLAIFLSGIKKYRKQGSLGSPLINHGGASACGGITQVARR